MYFMFYEMPLKLHFTKCSEGKISQCIFPLRTPFFTDHLRWLLLLLDDIQNTKKMKTKESKERKFEKSKGKDTLWNLSFRVFHEIHFQGHFMKHEMLSWNTFTLVSKFHCVRFSSIKKIVFTEKRYIFYNLIALNSNCCS